VIQRNRAEVNALFKEEHDRWAGVGGCRDGWLVHVLLDSYDCASSHAWPIAYHSS
jgi:hypothetical protein